MIVQNTEILALQNYSNFFFDDPIIDHIIEQSRINGVRKNWKDIQVSQQEMRVFLATLIISAYNPLLSKTHYWETEEDFQKNICQLNFKREIAMSYVKRFQNPPKKSGQIPMNLTRGFQILGLMVCIIMFRQLPMVLKNVLENYANLKTN